MKTFNSHWQKHPPHPPFSAPRTWSGGMLDSIKKTALYRLSLHHFLCVISDTSPRSLLPPRSASLKCSLRGSQRPSNSLPSSFRKAGIRNPSLQLCWQGLASLLAHERSRFAICQWELSTSTNISIPLTRRLVLRALEAGECLSAFKKSLHSIFCI